MAFLKLVLQLEFACIVLVCSSSARITSSIFDLSLMIEALIAFRLIFGYSLKALMYCFV